MSDVAPPEAPITHPEEVRVEFDLFIGKNINLKGSGRVTPAGVISVGLMTEAVFVAAAALVRVARRWADLFPVLMGIPGNRQTSPAIPINTQTSPPAIMT